jgi:hypothetical protein
MKEYRFLISAVMLFGLAFEATAQLDSLSLWRKYESDVIYFSGGGFIKGDVKHPLRDLKNEFDYSPLGKEVYRMARNDRNLSRCFIALGVASEFFWLTSIGKRQNTKATAGFLVFTASFGVAIHLSIRSVNRMQKAVWLRNRDVLLRK